MPIFAPVFRALKKAGVPFLVIGGHAVVLHGHLRNTFDLDLLISDSRFAAGQTTLSLWDPDLFSNGGISPIAAPEISRLSI